jgi:threonine/homoserine/homoserine lactone efflux protein
MEISNLIGYLLASAIIVIIPGPNILLIVSDSITHGFRKSMMTVLGITTGMAFLFSLSLTGVTAMLIMFSWLFAVIKWVGVVYLLYLGISQILSTFNSHYGESAPCKDKRSFFTKGFLISATNPKGLVFAGAFFPQFIRNDSDIIAQIVLLCGSFLLISLIIGIAYAFCSDTARRIFNSTAFKVKINRISGVLLVCFGIGLAFAREELE